MRYLIFLALWVAIVMSVQAQLVPVTILDPGELYSTYQLSEDAAARKALSGKGYNESQISVMFRLAHESTWPEGINDLSERLSQPERMQQYRGYLVATFGEKCILLFKEEDNAHLPVPMQPSPEFYMVFGLRGISKGAWPEVTADMTATGDMGDIEPTHIVNSGELYSTYGLCDEPEDKAAILKYMSESTFELVCELAEEQAWPEGIRTLESRNTNRSQINAYHAWAVAAFAEKILLWIPAAENRHMPGDMQPASDIFFIIGASGLKLGDMVRLDEIEAPAEGTETWTEARPVRIKDSGQLYSTYGLCDDGEETTRALLRTLTEDQLAHVCRMAHEDYWPDGINSLDDWSRNRDRFNDYICYQVAAFDTKVILWVPSDENRHMPAEMQPDEDIFFVMGVSGTEPGHAGAGKGTATSLSPKGFGAQLNVIYEAATTNFRDLIGDEIEEEILLGRKFTCTSPLDGSESLYLTQALLGNELTFIANFGEFMVKSQAEAVYSDLVAEVGEVRFGCCAQIGDEVAGDALKTAYFIPFSLSGLAPRYEKNRIEVCMLKGFGLHEGNFVDTWSVYIRVYQETED